MNETDDRDSTSRNPGDADQAGPSESTTVDSLIDDWGMDSFPASDPPGSLPPTLSEEEPA